MSSKSTQNLPKIHPKSTKNPPKFGSWELLGRLVELLEASWAHLDAKSQKVSKKVARWTSPAPKLHPKSTNNLLKFVPEAFQKAIVFLIGFEITF